MSIIFENKYDRKVIYSDIKGYMYVSDEAHGYREDKKRFAFYNKLGSFF